MNGPPHPTGTFSTYQQPTTVTPPGGSVDSWSNYQSQYEQLNHFNILSPAASPYGSYTPGQYGYIPDNQIYSVQRYELDSPIRVNGNGLSNIVPVDSEHHKTVHYTIDENKYDTVTGNDG